MNGEGGSFNGGRRRIEVDDRKKGETGKGR